MKTIDCYLLRRFGQVFGIGLSATLGLYVVFDGFTNVDAFQETAKSTSSVAMLGRMGEYYGYQSVVIFDLVAPIMTVIATMVVFSLLQKNKEVYPILSAGVPAYRLLWPMLVGSLAINGVLMLNQEFLLPAIAEELLRPIKVAETGLSRADSSRRINSAIDRAGSQSAFAQFSRLEIKVDRAEALDEAYDRMDGRDPDADELDRQFEEAERKETVADEFEQLKRQLAAGVG